MQVIQTINDTIRILFSPINEDFKLLDFLLVQEAGNRYLAQIIEIYDDKYDASQNVARVKLFFKVNDKGEVFGYDHFTPSKECEIKKIKRDEILTFINEGKESLTIGCDYQTNEPFDINLDFFKNKPVIFADKIEHSNNMSLHLAYALSRYNKHSVILDFSGTLNVKKAKKLVITKDIKLPLNFYTINYIWEKGLATASLETQAICREIFNEIQTFAKNTPDGFIPFEKFLNVIEIQYKATPIIELTVLLNKLNAYQKNNIFANNKKDFETITKAVEENEITIIDFSELKTSWHKEFCDFAIRNIKNAFVFVRLNETNADVDLIDFLYNKNPDISLITSISYTYSKMPHIIEHANNYILLPTLNPRRDFGAANFELTSISQDECILFGQNTENFIFTIKNNRFLDDSNNDSSSQKTIKLRLNENTSREIDLREKFKNKNVIENEYDTPSQEQIPTEEELDFFEQIENQVQTEEEKTLVKKPEEGNAILHYNEIDSETEQLTTENNQEELIELNINQNDSVQKEDISNDIYCEIQEQNIPQQAEENILTNQEEEIFLETTPEEEQLLNEEQVNQDFDNYKEIEPQEELVRNDIIESAEIEENSQIVNNIDNIETTKENEILSGELIEEEPLENEPLEEETDNENLTLEVEEIEETKQDAIEQEDQDKNIQEASFQNILAQTQENDEEEQDESLSLEDIAAQSIENVFNEVIENQEEQEEQDITEDDNDKLIIDDNVVIDLEKIKDHIDTENGSELPIFRSKAEKKEKTQYKAGDFIEHDKYGEGEVIKVINYANRSLLQINFKEVGKRLLDPDIANIREMKK